MTLNLPQNWRYFTIRDLYRFTDTKIVSREEQQVVSDKMDINGVYNYYQSYSDEIMKSIARHQTSTHNVNEEAVPGQVSDYSDYSDYSDSDEDYFP